MKKLAARDFEDLLQVCRFALCVAEYQILPQDMIPSVDGLLLEPYNSIIITLLYRLAEWHALAKLRMHTEHTLQSLENSTRKIGQELRSFRDLTLQSFKCQELPKETTARLRRRKRTRAQKAQANVDTQTKPEDETNPDQSTINSAKKDQAPPKSKILNLFTYKFHALGDYVRTIRLYGTTDSYSTQIVCFVMLNSFYPC